MAQDDYYYEIQLTNKQLVFYFLAGATVLILCFLLGIMVGRGVDARTGGETRVAREEAVVPAAEEPVVRGTPVPTEGYSYPQRLVTERVNETLEVRAGQTPATSAASPTPLKPAATVARSATTPTPAATPKTASNPKPRATASPKVTPTPRAASTAQAGKTPGEGPVSLQVGAFKDRVSADAVMGQLRKKGYSTHVTAPDGARGGLFIVRVGPYKTRVEAERARARLEQERFKPFIVRP